MGIPSYEIKSFSDDDELPADAEEFFADELAYSRQPLPADRADRDDWVFACVCALTDEGRVLGGVHLDIGPINDGPLGKERLAFVEGVRVRPEYRRGGVGERVMNEAIAVARAAGCLHMQCSVEWDNPAAIALYRKCGFALTYTSDGDDREYFVTRAVR